MDSSAGLIEGLRHIGVEIVGEYHCRIATVKNLTLDSRETGQQTGFVGIQGVTEHGVKFLQDAINRHSPIALIEDNTLALPYIMQLEENTLVVRIKHLQDKLPSILSFQYPLGKNIKGMVAVTGTNGKTSVVDLYAQITAQLGFVSASIGTLGVYLHKGSERPEKIAETINTSPDVISTYKYLNLLAAKGVSYVAIEASSHGIEQGRLAGLPIDTAIFTNLSQDHLDYHQNMQSYAAAKRQLLTLNSISRVVVNIDDPEAKNWLANINNNTKATGFSIASDEADLYAQNIQYKSHGLKFDVCIDGATFSVELPLLGKFNIQNTLAVIAALTLQGFESKSMLTVFKKLRGVAGRMELTQINGIIVLIDYAHTPDALAQALSAAKSHSAGRLWVVFGCGGNRDKSKRIEMGKVASQLADKIILTQDNPRDEAPDDIVADILAGIKMDKLVKIEHERENALHFALANAKKGDILLVAGKGHETYIESKGEKQYYDERAVVKALTERLI